MRLMPKPSLRDASCCIVAVVNAGLGRRRTVERATVATVKPASRIRRAAASAPARVSTRDIARLEHRFGGKLFERLPHGVRLTALGAAVAEKS